MLSSATYLTSRVGSVSHFPRLSTWDFLFRREEAAAELNDECAYVDATTGETVSRAELQSSAKALAYALRHRLGLSKGDCVLVFSTNSILFPATILAIQVAGLTCSPANAFFKPYELAYQIKDSGAKVVIAGQNQAAIAAEACAEAGVEAPVFLLDRTTLSDGAYKSVWDLTDTSELEPEPVSEDEAAHAVALLCYSSGTSGKPKGVKTTHFNITSALLQTVISSPDSFSSNQVWLATLPLSHMYGMFYDVFLAVHIHAKVIVLSSFTLDAYLLAIEHYRVTAGHIVPPIAVKLVKETLARDYNLSSVCEWRSAAAPAGEKLIESLEEKCGVPFHGLYAMTETTAVIAMSRQGERLPPGATGRLSPNVEAKILHGELWLKGPNVTIGYHNRPDADAEAFDDEGFMRTGDLVHIDDDGFIYVLDREKEVIKFNGFQVPPAELEDLLLKHPNVHDVAVIGVRDEERGTELPLACVVLKGAAHYEMAELNAKRKELIAFVAARVAHFKQLRGGVRFVSQIPKSPSGKVLRRLLREETSSNRADQTSPVCDLKPETKGEPQEATPEPQRSSWPDWVPRNCAIL